MTEERVLPIISERHECPQSVALVEVIEDLKSDLDRMLKAVNFHRDDAEALRRQVTQLQTREQKAVKIGGFQG